MAVGVTLANSVLDFTLRSNFDLFLSLHTAEPEVGASPDAHEVTGTGYAREALIDADWAPAAGGETATVNQISFPAAGGSWGTVTHVGLWDALTGGNLLWWGEMVTPKVVGSGDTIAFPVGNLSGTVV